TTTNPAVMRVTSTHPGTSPRSSRASSPHALRILCMMLSFRDWLVETNIEHEDTGEDSEEHGQRQDQEHQRQHHGDLFTPGLLDENALGFLARVSRLGVQHVRERCAAIERRTQV